MQQFPLGFERCSEKFILLLLLSCNLHFSNVDVRLLVYCIIVEGLLQRLLAATTTRALMYCAGVDANRQLVKHNQLTQRQDDP